MTVTVRIKHPVAVITPTINSKTLQDACHSVASQTYGNVHHYIVADGKDVYLDMVQSGFVSNFPNCTLSFVPDNTGSNGFYGHRIYAAYPHLLDHEFIFFLDEDNWYKPEHIDSLVRLIEQNDLDFAFSLRDVHMPDRTFVAEDNCESLGLWPIFNSLNKIDKEYLVDTSAYAFCKKFIQEYCHYWHWGWGADRRFLDIINSKTQNYNTTGEHTMCYRLDNIEKKYGSVDFFHEGNKIVFDHYGGYPWLLQKKTT